MYDYIIVGAGLFGSVCARLLALRGQRVLIIDKRDHVGGNCYSYKLNKIDVHKYGVHVFNTSKLLVYEYFKRYDNVTPINYNIKASIYNTLYTFPINLNTLSEVFGDDGLLKFLKLIEHVDILQATNLLEHILKHYGKTLYDLFFKGYTTKQWGKNPKNLPSSIISRIPGVRMNNNNSYYKDLICYICVPSNGYDTWFNNILSHDNIDVILNTFFDENKHVAKNKIIYTGAIDLYYKNMYGRLEYRSLRFEIRLIDTDSYQEKPVINFPDLNTLYTRIILHKKLNNCNTSGTVISILYPLDNYNEPYYPVNTKYNNDVYIRYNNIKNNKVVFGGRLGLYRYYNMSLTILSALELMRYI